jgi:hypothetical protein
MAKKKVKEKDGNDKVSVDITSTFSQMLEITKLLDERIDLMRDRIDVVNTRLDAFGDMIETTNAKLHKVAGRLGI